MVSKSLLLNFVEENADDITSLPIESDPSFAHLFQGKKGDKGGKDGDH